MAVSHLLRRSRAAGAGAVGQPLVVARIEFFEVMAQIGPVLLLTVVLEARRHERVEPVLGGLVATTVGEAMALVVVAGAVEPIAAVAALVGASMLLGISALPQALEGKAVGELSVGGKLIAWGFMVGAGALVVLSFALPSNG